MDKTVVTSTEALSSPGRALIVVGAGIIGLELVPLGEIGSKVTVVEYLPRILPTCDGEVATAMQKTPFQVQGFEFHLGVRGNDGEAEGKGAKLSAQVRTATTGSSKETRCWSPSGEGPSRPGWGSRKPASK